MEHFEGTLPDRLAAELAAKIRAWLALTVGICLPYFWLQRNPLLPIRSVPETGLDAAIPFDPEWAYAYVSIALLVPLLPLLATSREQLRRYLRGLAVMCGLCFVVFLVFPVEGPRPAAAPAQPIYGWLVSVDTKLNSMPSLHAGLAAYSLLFGSRILARGSRPPAWVIGIGLAWGAAILYGTLATKQHWVLDLPPGILAAWVGHTFAWRDVQARAG